jgi:hypothetical protein
MAAKRRKREACHLSSSRVEVTRVTIHERWNDTLMMALVTYAINQAQNVGNMITMFSIILRQVEEEKLIFQQSVFRQFPVRVVIRGQIPFLLYI